MNSVDNRTILTKTSSSIPAVNSRFLASDWNPLEKATLLGFFTLTLPSGLVLKGCTYHKGHGSHWVSLPAQTYKDKNGDIAYTSIIDFASREVRARFQKQALSAIEELLRGEAC